MDSLQHIKVMQRYILCKIHFSCRHFGTSGIHQRFVVVHISKQVFIFNFNYQTWPSKSDI